MTPRIIGPVLLVLLAACDASAFHLPTSRLVHVADGRTTRDARIVLSLSREEEEHSPQLPFFAKREEIPKSQSPSDVDQEDRNVDSEADRLRALAEKTRLEAEKMDLSLTLMKIDKLEQKIPDRDERSNLLRDTESLMKRINAQQQVTNNGMTLAKEKILSNETSSAKGSFDRDKGPSISDSEQKGDKNVVPEILDGEKSLLSDDKLWDTIDGFEELPQEIKDMIVTNTTAADFEEIFIDLEFAEISGFVKNLLPEVTRKEPVKEEYIDALYSEVLGKDTFNPRDRKPQAIPGGYLIRGESKVKPQEGKDDGDVLIEALDKKISESSVAGKIQAYYILDPTPPSGEEIMNEEDEKPLLLITSYDLSPDTQVWVKPTITLLGLASIALFSLGSFSVNGDVLNRISASADSGNGSLDLLYDLSLPLAISLLVIQILHEAGHLVIAVKDEIQIGLPTFVPGFSLGLTGAITPIKTSPKNIKSLFDFAITGPSFGLAASFIFLYLGLELTAFMDASAQEQLPSIPVGILRSSALGGGIIDFLLGDGVLNSPNPSESIRLHPYAIAGFAGLVANALSLLPIGNTDGGRISVSFFGRSFSRVVQGAAILLLVIAGFFGADPANILLYYAVYTQTWQKEAEVPCRNEVDELDSVRGFAAIGISLIVMLTLIPLP